MFTSKITNYCMNGVILVGDLFYYYVFHPHPVLEESSVSPPPLPPPLLHSLEKIFTPNLDIIPCDKYEFQFLWFLKSEN